MPRRIPNLSETILDEGAKLFAQFGYHAVEMKQVAAEAGTSVGNLYNYFASKPALFIAIVKRWRNEIFERTQAVLQSEQLGRREKILGILRSFYDNFASRAGLWKEFLEGQEDRSHFIEAKLKDTHGGHPWGFGPEEIQSFKDFEVLITGASPTEQFRWSYMLIMATIQLASRYPDNPDENWKFLETLVDKI